MFETIKVFDGNIINLQGHQERVNRARKQLFGTTISLSLESSLHVPPVYRKGVVKCRVSYGKTLGPVAFSNYHKKPITSLQQVECSYFDYSAKYQDRSKLEYLFQHRGKCDEVLITHDGKITDTSYSNVVLFDGSGWFTPSMTKLEGTQRAKLLDSGTIQKTDLSISDLQDFQKIVLINAMIEFQPEEFVHIASIKLWSDPPLRFTEK